jgi:hypothetical protein
MRARVASTSRTPLIAGVVVCAFACAANAAAVDDRHAADPKLRRFIDSMHGETIAVEVGRMAYRKRWEQVLTEGLYLIAPRGAWNETHPAWAPARQALADALRRESAQWLAANRDRVRLVINDRSMREMTEEERERTAAFFETRGGQVWRDSREAFARERAYGLPLVVESAPRADYQRTKAEKEKALLALPDATDGKVVYDFMQSPLGDKLLQLQNGEWARGIVSIFTSDFDAIVLEKRAALAAAVRTVPGVPPPSDKAYLGTVTMAPDRTFTVVVEHYRYLDLAGKYTLVYQASDLHWSDVAAAVPAIKAGETRAIYRDRTGRLTDRP